MCIDCCEREKISLCVNWRGNSGRKTRRGGGRIVNGTVFGGNYQTAVGDMEEQQQQCKEWSGPWSAKILLFWN